MCFFDFKRHLLVPSHFSTMFWHPNIVMSVLKKLELKVVLQENVNIKSNHKYLHSRFSSSKPGGTYQHSKRFKEPSKKIHS